MIADFHNDVLTAEFDQMKKLARELTCSVYALFRGGRSFADIRGIAQRFFAERPANVCLGLEDIGYLNEKNSAEIFAWNPIYASLTWNGSNELAGGCFCDSGLTPRGKCAVYSMSEHRVAVDFAHLNKRSFSEVLDLDPFAVVDSHTCLSSVCKHPRNLEDWQVREIVSRGGLIGIAFVGRFLSEGKASASDIFRHIDYGVQKFGIDAFCLGSDFWGTADLPDDIGGYADLAKLRAIFYAAGYSESDTDKIFAVNLKNFLSKKEQSQ